MDVSKSNISRLMESLLELGGITNFKKFDPLKESKLEEIVEEEEETDREDYLKIDEFKIIFLPMSTLDDFTKKSKYDNFFHAAYFSNTGTTSMGKHLIKILKPKALVVFETAKFVLEMKNEQINSFSQRLNQIATECDLTRVDMSESKNVKKDENKVSLENEDFYAFKYIS